VISFLFLKIRNLVIQMNIKFNLFLFINKMNDEKKII
jgi:hypothetical protein